MNIIVDITAFGYEPNADFAMLDLIDDIQNTIEDGDVRCSLALKAITLGQHDPDRVITIAKDWNHNIRKAFLDSLRSLTDDDLVAAEHSPAAVEALTQTLPLDDPRTFAVSLAARAIDNHWHPFSNYGVYRHNDLGYPYWHVTLTDDALKDIVEHPEKYAIGYMAVT